MTPGQQHLSHLHSFIKSSIINVVPCFVLTLQVQPLPDTDARIIWIERFIQFFQKFSSNTLQEKRMARSGFALPQIGSNTCVNETRTYLISRIDVHVNVRHEQIMEIYIPRNPKHLVSF